MYKDPTHTYVRLNFIRRQSVLVGRVVLASFRCPSRDVYECARLWVSHCSWQRRIEAKIPSDHCERIGISDIAAKREAGMFSLVEIHSTLLANRDEAVDSTPKCFIIP